MMPFGETAREIRAFADGVRYDLETEDDVGLIIINLVHHLREKT